jgi:hypothetical protein
MIEALCIRTCSLDRYYQEGETYFVDETNKYVKAYFKLPEKAAVEEEPLQVEPLLETPKKRTRKVK